MGESENGRVHHRTPEMVRDIVIGMADGLTVPFALAAGLAGAVPTTKLILTAGLAEIAAGAIAMGLGGFLAVRSDHEYYVATREAKHLEVEAKPEPSQEEAASLLREWDFEDNHVSQAVETLTKDPARLVDFLMKYRLGLEQPRPGRARDSSLTIGLSYIVGGLFPLAPYMIVTKPYLALLISVFVTLCALFVFGWVKGKFLGTNPLKSAFQTMVVGGLAALVAYGAAKWIA